MYKSSWIVGALVYYPIRHHIFHGLKWSHSNSAYFSASDSVRKSGELAQDEVLLNHNQIASVEELDSALAYIPHVPFLEKKNPDTVSLRVSQFLLTRNTSQLRVIYEYSSPCCLLVVTTLCNTSIQTLLSLHFANWCRYFNFHFWLFGILARNIPFVNLTLSF